MASHDVFAADIVFGLDSFEAVDHVLKLAAQRFEFVGVLIHPGGRGGFEQQYAVDLPAAGEDQREPREVVGHHMIFAPPWRVV